MPTSISSTTLEKFSTFGDLLRFLRRRVGMTQIELATQVGYSDTQISRLEQNLRLPDLPTIEARFISALDLEHEPNAVARLLDLAANVRREDAPGLGLCPYKGLNYFDEADADLFVGREEITTKLTERVLSLASDSVQEEPRFLAIVGASGSGKSSLVRAGLVSALRWNKASTDWHIHVLTPTAHPLESLAAALSDSVSGTATLMDDLARDWRSLQIFTKRKWGEANGRRVLLVIDQFEELFALCRSEEERGCFIGNLLTAASETDGPVMVLITLRADFYAPCANYPALREALARSQEFIGAMSHAELRRSIEEPARRGRWELESGLVNLLLHDVGHEPGALPLLSHALFETWQRRRGRLMTMSGYASSGGVRGAIAETAEMVFSDQFTREQRAIARRIFLRLTELGDEAGAGDTRRRATFDELILRPEEAATTHAVLKALADARLITTTEHAAEVAHEALIREWPTLHGWLEENREGLRLHRQLTETTQDWSSMDHDPDLLYRGARLAQTREWAFTHESEMNELEREFLNASIALNEHELEEREAQRQRELEAAQKLATSEKQRAEEQSNFSKQLSRRARYISVAFVVVLVLAVVSLFFSRQSQIATRLATSRELAAAAINNLEVDPELSILLALQAESTIHTPEAENALHRSILASRTVLVVNNDAPMWDITFSPDGGRFAATSQDETAKVWDAKTGQLLLTLTGHTDEVAGIVYSPDGKRIATTSDDHTARIWEAETGQLLLTLTDANEIRRCAFSPDGTRLVTTAGTVWDATTGKQLLTFSGHQDFINDVSFNPDGHQIATSSHDGTVRIWDATTGQESLVLSVASESGSMLRGVAFSPDGKRVAVVSDGMYPVKIWDAATGEVLFRGDPGHTLTPNDIAFSPDGRLAISAGDDPKAKVWDTMTGQVLYTLSGHTESIIAVAFSPDGKQVATAGADGTARIWDITPATELLFIPFAHPESKWSGWLSYNPDGTHILTDYTDSNARVWDAVSGKELMQLGGFTAATGAFQPSYSPDGKWIAAGNGDDKINVWDAQTGEQRTTLVGFAGWARHTAFSPDGTRLASANDNDGTRASNIAGTITIWDVANAKALSTMRVSTIGITSVAYSPDGKHLISGDWSGLGIIWDAGTGDKMAILPQQSPVTAVSYSPDGKLVATGSHNGIITLWNALTGEKLLTWKGHIGWVNAVPFSPDGKRIATVAKDGTVRVWDVVTGESLLTLPVDAQGAGGVAFSPDGKRLAVGGYSGIYIFALPIEDVVELAESRTTRTLTLEECQQYLHMEQCPSAP